MLEQFNSLVGGLPAPVVYGIVAGLVFAEAALFFGFVFPGETAIIVGGVLASQGKLSLPVLLVCAVLAAIVGDSVGYEIGRRYGLRLLETPVMRKHRGKVVKAQELIRRRGAFAVFIGRFTALLRALMPALVGSARLPYGKFLLFNAIGGLVWAVGFTMGGYLAGEAFEHVAKLLSRGLAAAVAIVVVIAAIVWSVRKHRRDHAAVDRADAGAPPEEVVAAVPVPPVPAPGVPASGETATGETATGAAVTGAAVTEVVVTDAPATGGTLGGEGAVEEPGAVEAAQQQDQEQVEEAVAGEPLRGRSAPAPAGPGITPGR